MKQWIVVGVSLLVMLAGVSWIIWLFLTNKMTVWHSLGMFAALAVWTITFDKVLDWVSS